MQTASARYSKINFKNDIKRVSDTYLYYFIVVSGITQKVIFPRKQVMLP